MTKEKTETTEEETTKEDLEWGTYPENKEEKVLNKDGRVLSVAQAVALGLNNDELIIKYLKKLLD